MVYGRPSCVIPYHVYEYTQPAAACQGPYYARAQVGAKRSFGERLKEALDARGLKQNEFAALAEIRDATISDWVNNKGQPRAEQLIRICEKLDISAHWLLTGEGPMERPAGADGYTGAMLEAAALARSLLAELERRAGKPAPKPEAGEGEGPTIGDAVEDAARLEEEERRRREKEGEGPQAESA